MSDLDDFNRLVGYWRAYGLSESEAHAKAESEMESDERNCNYESGHLCTVFVREPKRNIY